MAPATGTALLILVAFVLPGFITVLVRETTYVVRGTTTPFELLLLSLGYSARIYGVLAVGAFLLGARDRDITALYHGHRGLGTYLVIGTLVMLVLPVVIAELGRLWARSKTLRPGLLKRLRISISHGTQSGWDHFFGNNSAALVRATLDDGRVVAGYFGEQSLAGYSEDTQDLFLEQRWVLDEDGWFKEPAPSSFGVWLSHEHVVSLEVYDPAGQQIDSAIDKRRLFKRSRR